MGSGWLRSVAVHIEKLLSPGFVVFGSGSDLKIKDIIQFCFVKSTMYMLGVCIYTKSQTHFHGRNLERAS